MFVALLVCTPTASVRAADALQPLQPGSYFTAELSPGQHRRYRIGLPAGQTALVSIRQNDAMLQLHVGVADEAQSTLLQTQAGREALLQWPLLAEAATVWELDVAAAKTDRAASYRLAVGAAHPTRANDRAAATAERAYVAAETIRRAAGGVESGRQAADVDSARARYGEAAQLWQQAQMPCATLRAGVGLARLELALARYPQAEAAAQAALARHCNDVDPAVDAERAAALRTSASALGYQGDFEASAERSERALALYRRTGDRRFQGVVLGNLSEVYRSLGETQKALEAAQSALDIARATGDAQGVEFSRDTLADAHLARGEFGSALAIYRQTLADLRVTPYPLTEGLVWNELGNVYQRLGESGDARAAWAHARAVWQASGNRSGMAETWISEGDAALDEGNSATAAAAFTRALEIARADRLQSPQLHALRGLGRVAAAAADLPRARDQLQASLALARELGESAGISAAEQALGDLDAGAQQWPAAREHYRNALAEASRSADASAQAAAQASLAHIDAQLGDLDSAESMIEHALAIVETQRAAIADPGLRTGFFASQHEYFGLAIDIQIAQEAREPGQGHGAQALETAERARARSLQDLLAERSIAIDGEVDPALLAAERAAEDQQRRLAYRLARAGSSGGAPALLAEIASASREVDAARGRLRLANSRYAEIAHPTPVQVADVRMGLLDADTAVFEYWLGESRSYLWIVQRDSLHTFVLPARRAIAAAARDLRGSVMAHAQIDAAIPIERRAVHDADEAAATQRLAADLAAQILPIAARALLPSQWAIVADAELQDVPFALLVAAIDAKPVLVQLPSIGALRAMRALPHGTAPRDALAILADPVFAHDDPRLQGRVAASPRLADGGVNAARATEIASLPRLVQARAEAQEIAALASKDRSWLALGFDANRGAVLRAHWADYAVAHFATHALVNARRPELSGIVLSLYDADGRADDGFLRINDLYAARMPLELVVLGVCDAAQGVRIDGEGVQSLARAFFYAGTRRVVASLWPVDDRASAVFMQAFYRGLLQERLPPQHALARAQAELRQNARWNAAYYWSGFVMQGDWQ